MPQTIYITQEKEKAPGKNIVTVLPCPNAAGYVTKAAIIYKATDFQALKRKNKGLLPMYWISNR